MPGKNMLPNSLLDRVLAAVAAGVTVQNGSGVDMSGFEGVLFVASIGTLTATQVTALKAQQSDDDGSSDDYSDLAGSEVGPMDDADSDKLLILDVYRPRKRFVRPVVTRGTANAVIDGVVAIRYRNSKGPVTQGSTVSASEITAGPDEGTA